MHWLDIVIIVWLAASLISGVRMGFIYKLATLIGYVVGLYLGSRYTPVLVEKWNLGPLQMPTVFFFIMTTTSKVFGILGWVVNKLFHLVARVPFIKTFNRVLGGVLSVVLTCFMASSVLFIAHEYSPADSIPETIEDSSFANSLLKLSVFYKPLLSEKLNVLVDTAEEKTSSIPSADIPPK